MSFTPEQEEVLNKMFSTFGESLLSKIDGNMNTALSGLGKRLTSEIPKVVDAKFGTLEEKIQGLQYDPTKQEESIRTALNKVLEELAAEEGDKTPAATGDNSGTQPTGSGVESPAIRELKQQLEAQAKLSEQMKQRLLQAENLANEERQTREKLAEQQRIAGMEEALIGGLRGKVRQNAERDFLNLLRNNEMLIEDNNQLLIKSKDQHGFDVNLPIDQALPTLLKDRFSYMAEVRAGTGTGSTGSSSNTGTQGQQVAGKYFNGGSKMPSQADLMAAMSDPSKQAELFSELQALS